MQVIALLFRRGNGILTEKDFVLSASMALNWFTPKEAQKLLDVAIERELVLKDGGVLRPNFEYMSIDIPLNFKPGKMIFLSLPQEEKERKKDLFTVIVERIADKTKLQKREVIGKINRQQERLNLEIEVAGLIVGRELDVDISDLILKVEEEISRGMRGEE